MTAPILESRALGDIGRKVEHVRAEIGGDPGGHHCHWPNCPQRVPPAAWGCKKHWYTLPKYLRDKIWAAYRIGQEQTKTPSAQYVAVAKEAQEWIYNYLLHFPPKPTQGKLL